MHKSYSFERDYMPYCAMSKHTAAVISERRQKLFALLTRGMKGYEIARAKYRSVYDKPRYQISNVALAELFERPS